MKVDTGGTILWTKIFGDDVNSRFTMWPSDLKATYDGGYIIVANFRGNVTNATNPILIKTNANGDTLWTRTHGNTHSTFTPNGEFSGNVIETRDHGFMFGVRYEEDPLLYGFEIIKTDSLGNVGCYQHQDIVPFNSVTLTDSLITLTAVSGAYNYTSNVHDTVLAPFDVWNGCTFTGIEHYYTGKGKTLVYPNPNSGNFKIKTSELQKKNKQIIVYDSYGTIILKKENVKDDEPQIDLSIQAKGVYYIKVIEGEKVSTSKVVVE